MKHFIVLLILLLALSACIPQESPEEPPLSPSPQGGSIVDRASLIDALRAAGAEVTFADPVQQDFFSVGGQMLRVNGVDVQVFEYASAAARADEAAQVAPNGGSIGASMVAWMATPHFYQSGRILVLYVGDDAATLDLLQGVLGQQFAGR